MLAEDIRTSGSTIVRLKFVTVEATGDSAARLLFTRIVDALTDSQLGTESARVREEGHCLQREHALTSTADLVDLISSPAVHGGADGGVWGNAVASFQWRFLFYFIFY